MDEVGIARATAVLLNGLENSGDSESPGNGHVLDGGWQNLGPKLSGEQLLFVSLERKKFELAMSRATATGRDFGEVLTEIEDKVSVQLARILADTVDPVLESLTQVVVEEEGHVCGVCQDEMEVGEESSAMGCNHTFHGPCIYKWLNEAYACPLCRYRI
ncbi:probable E3 ubiquitin-protein ligase RHC1A [Cornus florida]|uniref:probable E3 ubiquitin-protein ligase RHC1A n=1 Tax=Cornus florida TaxID=4283 RepID=UPI00289F51DA|nr:probable E3 ubiquitin-protein ligase RHC1A [Cornus florida]